MSRTVPSQHEIDSIRETITAWQNEKDNLQNGIWNLTPGRATNHGWDQLVDPWIEFFPTIGDKIPSAYRIWQSAHRYYKAGDKDRADRCERLNYILHNSYIPAALQLRGEVTFAYGGIGVILHQDADIFPHVTIGANTTIDGNGSQVRIDERTGRKTTVPLIGTLSTIGAGANITGGIEIGPLSIIAPNTVVTKSHPAGSILAGAPARPIAQITLENCLRYKAKFLPARSWSNEQFIDFTKNHLV
ncbi:hypothetical protein [Rothia nasimurium]|uniref:hypothetical protein n=1 Tax=Rothia nasimurium TaxID=85336 RepID=UPI003BA39EEE